jgi:hypothetical protein
MTEQSSTPDSDQTQQISAAAIAAAEVPRAFPPLGADGRAAAWSTSSFPGPSQHPAPPPAGYRASGPAPTGSPAGQARTTAVARRWPARVLGVVAAAAVLGAAVGVGVTLAFAGGSTTTAPSARPAPAAAATSARHVAGTAAPAGATTPADLVSGYVAAINQRQDTATSQFVCDGTVPVAASPTGWTWTFMELKEQLHAGAPQTAQGHTVVELDAQFQGQTSGQYVGVLAQLGGRWCLQQILGGS